ncbi:4364_t:CDS:2, partial [Diversispora eburnea]
AVPPRRYLSPSPPPTKKRGRPLKRGPGRPRKNVDNAMPKETKDRKAIKKN